MSKNQIEFFSSDEQALDYIRMRGYCSYGSMSNVRDKKIPEPFKITPYYTFGKELHSRFLERKKLQTLPPDDELRLRHMVCNLSDDPMVQRIMEGALVEQEFDVKINGLRMYGRIDILTFAIADLKTTSQTKIIPFATSMDFLQAAIYTRAKKKKEFYYVGSCKLPPYQPMIFSTLQYPGKLKEANDQLDYYSRYIKNKL